MKVKNFNVSTPNKVSDISKKNQIFKKSVTKWRDKLGVFVCLDPKD